MASISTDGKNRRRTLQFVSADGKRRSIRLGKMSLRAAEKMRVEQLNAATVAGCGWDNELARWVANLPDDLAD